MKKRVLALLIALTMILTGTVSTYADTSDVAEPTVSANETTEETTAVEAPANDATTAEETTAADEQTSAEITTEALDVATSQTDIVSSGGGSLITIGAQTGDTYYATPLDVSYSLTSNDVAEEDMVITWYVDAEKTQTCSAPSGIEGGINASYDEITFTNSIKIPAGTYYFTVSGSGVESNVASYVIDKLEVFIETGSAKKVYDGTPLTCEDYDVGGFAEGEGIIVSCTGSQTEVGNSPNTVSYEAKNGTDLSNYSIIEQFGNLSVVSDAFVVKGENYAEIYDGMTHTSNVKVIGKNGVDLTSKATIEYKTSIISKSGPWGDWQTEAPTVKDYGTTFIKAKATYKGVTIESDVYTMGVGKRIIYLTSKSAQKEYDGTALTAPSVEQSGAGFVDGEGFTQTPVATGRITKAGKVRNEITYSLNATTTKAENYVIIKQPGTLTVTAKSTPITITTASNYKKYDGNYISAGQAAYTKGILLAGDELTVTLLRTGDEAVKDAGSYDNSIKSYVVTNGAGEDVTICYTFAEPVIGKLTIDKRYVTITSESKVFTHDGYNHSASNVTISGEGFAGAENPLISDFTVVKEITDTPVSNTFVLNNSATCNLDNYSVDVKYGTLSVVNQLGIIGTNVDVYYDGKTKAGPASAAGTAATPEYSTSTDGKTWSSYTATVPTIKDAGELYVRAKVVDGGQVAETSYTMTVRPRPVTISTASATKPYDATALTANDPATDVFVSGCGFVAGETYSISITGTLTDVGTAANSFTCIFGGSAKESNYAITKKPGTLTVSVNDKPICITSGSESWLYNGTALRCNAYTATWGGADIDDGKLCGKDVISVTPIASITDVGKVANEFKYQVIRDGSEDVTAFYTFECKEGTLEVKTRSIVISTASAEKVYDGSALTNNKYTVTGDGFVSGEGFEKVNIVGRRTNAGTSKNLLSDAEPYTFKVGTKEENYKVSVVTGTLTVNKRKVTVQSGTTVIMYSDCPSSGLTNTAQCTVTGDGFVSGEIKSGYPKGDGFLAKPNSDKGNSVNNTIDYGWTGKGNPANYEITEVLGSLAICKTGGKFVASTNFSCVYDGKAHSIEVYCTLSGTITYKYKIDDGAWSSSSTSLPSFKDVKYNQQGEVEAYTVDIEVSNGTDTLKVVGRKVTIYPRELTLTAASAEKFYDGTVLTCSDYIVGGDGLVAGEQPTITMTASSKQTDAGETDNIIKELSDNVATGFKTSNYKISYADGTLTVKKRHVILMTKGLEAIYDGTEHGCEEVIEVGNKANGGSNNVEGMGFVGSEGFTYFDFASYKDAGYYQNSFSCLKKANTDPSNYVIEIIKGIIHIAPRQIVLTTGSDQKKYDGTPLTNDTVTATLSGTTGDAFVEGEGAAYTVTGSQTTVGRSDNTFRYTLYANTKKINYEVTTEVGTLEVIKSDALSIVIPEDINFSYDGKIHGDSIKAYINGQLCTDALVSYSIDGGITWSSEAPRLTNPGTVMVIVKVEKEGYETVQKTYTLTVKNADASTTTMGDSSKLEVYITLMILAIIGGYTVLFVERRRNRR